MVSDMELQEMVAVAERRGEFDYADILAGFDDSPVPEPEDEDE